MNFISFYSLLLHYAFAFIHISILLAFTFAIILKIFIHWSAFTFASIKQAFISISKHSLALTFAFAFAFFLNIHSSEHSLTFTFEFAIALKHSFAFKHSESKTLFQNVKILNIVQFLPLTVWIYWSSPFKAHLSKLPYRSSPLKVISICFDICQSSPVEAPLSK